MKKFIITLVLALLPAVFFAQSPFDKFEGKEGVNVVVINKKMFDLLSSVDIDCKDPDVKKYLKQAENLDNLKIFATSSKEYTNQLKDTFTAYLKKDSFKELMSFGEGKKKSRIYIKSEGKSSKIKEVLMLVDEDNEVVVFSLTGNITL
jgi:hypothetical protein